MRIPEHIGIIPDGNKRWAIDNNLSEEEVYKHGINPGLELFKLCQKEGIKEITFYGYTVDHMQRQPNEKDAFIKACVDLVMLFKDEDCELLIVGDTATHTFPYQLLPFTKERVKFGKGGIKVNFLIHYGWMWDLNFRKEFCPLGKHIDPRLKSRKISKVDLIMRWGSIPRLSGFLPVQSAYADLYVIDSMWPDFNEKDFYDALNWYNKKYDNY